MSGQARAPRIGPALAGIIAGAVIAVIVGIMAKINLDFAAPWTKTHTLIARVHDADGIGVSSDVRIAGRLVGQVTGVRARGTDSEVTFHVDDSEWPLPATTTASIRLATLLGQKYVELHPDAPPPAAPPTDPSCTRSGLSADAKLPDDGIICLEATQDVVDFDQIISGFDKPTRDHLTNLIKTAAGALSGQEGTLQQLLPDLHALADDSLTPTATLAANDAHLNTILENLGTVSDQLDSSRNDLAGVIDNLNTVTGALASHQDALRGFIRNGDNLDQLTNAVLGNGGAQQLAAGLQRLDPAAHQADHFFTTLIPQNVAFNKDALTASITNIFEIGDATSQGNQSGDFLRQDLQQVDLLGITAPPSSHGPAANGSTRGSSPGLQLPGLPSLPSLPTVPALPLPPGIGGLLGPGGIPNPFGGAHLSALIEGAGIDWYSMSIAQALGSGGGAG